MAEKKHNSRNKVCEVRSQQRGRLDAGEKQMLAQRRKLEERVQATDDLERLQLSSGERGRQGGKWPGVPDGECSLKETGKRWGQWDTPHRWKKPFQLQELKLQVENDAARTMPEAREAEHPDLRQPRCLKSSQEEK